jgi:hypothetical protein
VVPAVAEGPAAPMPNPDADLLAACAEFRAIDAQMVDLDRVAGYSDEDRDAVSRTWWRSIERITHITPFTTEGTAAKAHVALRAVEWDVKVLAAKSAWSQADATELLVLTTLAHVASEGRT